MNMNITIDIISKLRKIYEGKTFSDRLVLITELFQNSQRSGAKNVEIELSEGKFTFYDDGCGCSKPSNIMTLDYSEWGFCDEGFGIGLWSWLAIEGVTGIEIESVNWKSSLSIKDIFGDGNLSVNVEVKQEEIKGFKVSIYSGIFNKYAQEVIDRVKSDGEMLNSKVYFNGDLMPKRDLHGEVEGEFIKHFSNKYFEATLVANKKFEYPNVYYERRAIDNFNTTFYVSGVIESKKKALTLQEPDRKNVINDLKKKEFISKVNDCRKELYLEIVKSGDSKSIDKYSYEIDSVLLLEDYEKYILVDDLILEVQEHERIVRDFNPNEKVNSFNRLVQAINDVNKDTQLSLTDNREDENQIEKIEMLLNTNSDDYKWVKTSIEPVFAQYDANTKEITEELLTELDNVQIGSVVYKKVEVGEFKALYSEEDEEVTTSISMQTAKKTKKKDSLKSVIKKINRKVWVKASEVEEYAELIAKVEYYGVKVFVAKNVLHENVFIANNVSYITDIESGINKSNIKWDVELKTKKEERFIELLQPICQYYNLPMNTFKVGYLKLLIETTLDNKVINREIIENKKDSVKIYAVCDGNSIILDRRALGLQRFNLSGGNIGVNEIKVLIATLKTISHELAHLLYDTEDNTKGHLESENLIYDELVNLYLTI